MNFLSHFYIDRNNESSYFKLGVVLPDLLRNYNRKVRSNKIAGSSENDPEDIRQIKSGIKKHHRVDKLFHSSEFFKSYQATIKEKLLLYQLPKPFFVPHLFLEILLDRILLIKHSGVCEAFYSNLKKVNLVHIEPVFVNDLNYDHNDFSNYIKKFMHYQYIFSYLENKSVIFAINRICSGIGVKPPYNDDHNDQLTLFITEIENNLKKNYLDIFLEINIKC